MVRPSRLTGAQLDIQRGITAALQTAHEHRKDARRYRACIDYAARTLDQARRVMDRET